MMRKYSPCVTCVLLILFAGNLRADVVSSSATGFLVQTEARVAAPPDSVYRTLVHHIGEWWDAAHTFSGDASNLSMEASVGGCFCETLPDGGGVRHLEVVYVAPGQALRLSGGLGPLQASGLAGSLTWSFAEQGDSAQVVLRYSVGGYMDGDLVQLAPIVDGVLRGQLLRLKAFAETGHPESE